MGAASAFRRAETERRSAGRWERGGMEREREERADTHMVDNELVYRQGRARSLERARRRVGTAPATVAALGRGGGEEARLGVGAVAGRVGGRVGGMRVRGRVRMRRRRDGARGGGDRGGLCVHSGARVIGGLGVGWVAAERGGLARDEGSERMRRMDERERMSCYADARRGGVGEGRRRRTPPFMRPSRAHIFRSCGNGGR